MKHHLTILCLTLATLLWPAKLFAQEPYAVLSDNNTVLTFYYDGQKAARGGMDVGPFTYSNGNLSSGWDAKRETITNVVFDPSFASCTTITSTAYWFYKMSNLSSITGIEYLNTGNVTDMHSMFDGCSGLTALDVTHFDTGNVTRMDYMFFGCSGLTELDVTNFDTQNVTDMGRMFYGCSGLTSLDVTNFNTGNVTDMSEMFHSCSSLTALDVTHFNTGNVTDMSGMFYGCSGLTSLDVTNFNTGNVTDMSTMFYGCISLTSLDVTNFNTGNVTDMSWMFSGCSGLTALDVTNFDTGNVTDMHAMFQVCSGLTALDVSHFNTGNVTDMSWMFSGCSGLTALDVTNFNTGNVTRMDDMFRYCSGLTALDVTNFNTGNVTRMDDMFHDCSGLTALDVTNFSTGNVTNMQGMFERCSGLKALDVTHFDTGNVTSMGWMFEDCSGLTSLDLSSFNTSKVIYDNGNYKYGIEGMFSGCSGLTTIYVGDGWTTTNLTQSPDVFKDCTHLVGGAGTHYDANHTDYTYARIDGGPSNPGYFTASGAEPWTEPTEAEPYAVLSDNNTVLTFYYDNQKAARGGMDVGPFYLFFENGRFNTSSGWDDKRETITNVVFDPSFASCTTITSTAYWFYGMKNVHSILGLEYLNTGNVTDMRSMFYGCSSLTALDVTHFDTGKVTNMGEMFSGCNGLTALDVTNFDTGKVTWMYYMFHGCSGLTSLDVTHFDTGNVTLMHGMFRECSGLTALDVTHFDTGKVNWMHDMFRDCSGLTSLDVTHFNTGNVTDMDWMFEDCSGLTSLDLSSFNTSKVIYDEGNNKYGIEGMFSGCSSLTTIYVGDGWTTTNLTQSPDVFKDCTHLVGGNGTAYDANHTDYTYARIDKPGEPGYLTDKNAPVMTEAVATPTFVINDNTLTISTTTSGASIHYTMDGTTPTAESTLYSGAIILTHNCTVRAIAVKEGMENSEEGTLEVGGLTKTAITPKPTISREGNTVAISIPGISENYIDATASVAVEPASWGGSAPKADLSGEWTCTVYNNGGDVSETYPMTLNSDGSGIYPDPCLSGSWTYNNGTLTLDHFKLSSGDNYNYDIYSLTATNPDNPIEFTGTRTRTVGNAWTENNSTANVKLTYNGTSLGVKGVTTDDGRETTAIIADEGDTEKTGTMLQQSVTGLDNGYYTVEMFAKSQSSSAVPMATDVTYLFANGIRLFIPVEADREIKEHNIYQIGVEVTDGTLNLGLGKEKNGANWHALQIKSLRRHALATDQPIEATAYYTLDGTTPTTSSPQYTTPIELTQSCTVKAIAVANSYLPSEVAILEVEIVPSEAEPYAVLSDDNTVLTFYYDGQKEARGGMDVGPFFLFTKNDRYNTSSGWDDKRETITNVVFDPSFASCTTITSTAYWFYGMENLSSITGIEYLNTGNVTNMRLMFFNCSGLTSLDLTHFDTGNVMNMGYMFYGCSGLTALDVTNFDTGNVTDMGGMFSNCSGLTSLDVTNFNTGNVTDMSYMFLGCSSLTSLDVTSFDTGNVTDMYMMFSGCSGLTSLDVTNFDTGNVTDMGGMFEGCSGLTSLDVTNFDTGNVAYMTWMFSGCSGLTSIYAGEGWSTEKVTGGLEMFTGCTHLVGGAGTHYDANHTDYTYARIDKLGEPGYFTDKNAPAIADAEPYAVLSDDNTVLTFYYDGQKAVRGGMGVGPFTYTYDGSHISDFVRPDWFEQRESITTVVFDGSFANCTSLTSTAFWFYRCENLISIEGIQNLKTDNVTDMGFMFDYCSSLTSLDVSGFNTSKVERFCGLFSGCSLLTSIDVSHFDTSNVWDFRLMFSNCSSLTELNISNFNTEIATAMGGMFQVCSKLTKLDLRSFNTENVFGMGWLFSGCSALTDLDISTFKTSSAGEMNAMFANCTSLTNIDVRNFDTSNVTLMQGMFYGCEGLTSLDVSHFNTGNVMDMGDMFGGCSGLTSLDVTSFKTDNVTEMDRMFKDCSGLTSLDLSSFNTSKVIYDEGNNKYGIEGMFSGCSSLTTIYVGDGWTTTNLTQSPDVFKDCTHLVGGAGTHYDENHTDYTYAHIDGGPSNPGYFTASGAEPWTEPTEAEPYAVLSDNNTVLTFYYDDQKAARGGMGVGPFYYDSETWDGHGNKITTVVFDISFADYTTLTNMNYWFSGFSNLTTIQGMENLHTDNLTRCAWLFDGCSSLKSIDLSHFKTDEVTYMRGMFIRCPALEVLDLSTFNTAKATDMMGLFADDTSLQVVYVGEGWTVSGITDDYLGKDMFENCTKLVGGKGTTYDENHTDYSYAHIDGGPSNPGYFTDKNAPVIMETAATPTIAVDEYTLTISTETKGATIHYTMDGTEPTEESALYTVPITLTQDCTVKAIALKEGYHNSGVAIYTADWVDLKKRLLDDIMVCMINLDDLTARLKAKATVEEAPYLYNLAEDINHLISDTDNKLFHSWTLEELKDCADDIENIRIMLEQLAMDIEAYGSSLGTTATPVMALNHATGTLTITCATAGSIIYYIIGDGETQAYNGTVDLTDNSTVRAWATTEGYDDSAEATLKPIQNGTADGQTFRISGAVTAQELLFLRNVMGSQVEHLDMADATLTDGGLADEAFRGMGLLTAQLPKSVGTVGSRLFNGCRRLAAIVWNAPTDITATALEGIGNPNLLLYVGSEATGRNAGVRNRIVNGTAQEITLSDPTATSASDCNFFCPIAFTANHISYSHIYTQQTGMDGNSRGWETLALPFDVQQVEHRVKGAVVPFGNSLAAPHFWLYSLGSTGWVTATTIAANSPYIIAMPQHPDYAAKYCLGGDSITFSAANAAVPVTAPQQATAGAKTLHANFTAQAASDDIFAINIGDPYDDTHPEGSIFLSARRTVRPFEAYTTTTASGVRFIELFDDEANGIMEMEYGRLKIDATVYDLQGRKQNSDASLKKGIYIIGGQKTIIRK